MSDLILLKRTSIRFAILCIWAVVWGTFPAAAQNGIPASPPSYSLILFRDAISLTLYAPRLPDGVGVSIVGLIFQVSDESGTTAHSIERYAAFRGISFDNLPAPVCFHLKLAGSNVPIPIECGEGTLLLDQSLAASDVFWYDAATNEGRLITVVHHGEVVGICPAGRARCEMTYAVTVAPTPPVPTASTTTVPTTLPTETPAADPIPTIQYRGDKPVIQFANPLGVKGEVEAYQMNPGASNSAVQAVGCVTGGTNLALELATNIYLVVPFSEFRQAVKEGDKHRVTLANGDEFVTALSITVTTKDGKKYDWQSATQITLISLPETAKESDARSVSNEIWNLQISSPAELSLVVDTPRFLFSGCSYVETFTVILGEDRITANLTDFREVAFLKSQDTTKVVTPDGTETVAGGWYPGLLRARIVDTERYLVLTNADYTLTRVQEGQ